MKFDKLTEAYLKVVNEDNNTLQLPNFLKNKVSELYDLNSNLYAKVVAHEDAVEKMSYLLNGNDWDEAYKWAKKALKSPLPEGPDDTDRIAFIIKDFVESPVYRKLRAI
jgi:hypothetical protein